MRLLAKIRDFFSHYGLETIRDAFLTTTYVISQDTAQTLSKALTTLRPGDTLEIEALGSKIVIFCKSKKIKKKKTHETH